MPPRNKRTRVAVKAEPSDCDSESGYSTSDSERHDMPKRVKLEEVKSEELSDDDIAIVLSEAEMSDGWQRAARVPVKRSAGRRPPRRGVDVGQLYEESGVTSLPRSLGQVVKEEVDSKPLVHVAVKEEGPSGSPLRVSDYVRRAAAARADQLLRGDSIAAATAEEQNNDEKVSDRSTQFRSNGSKHGRRFTEEQRAILRAQFDRDPYPDRAAKKELSKRLDVGYSSVHYWFKNQRKREGTVASGDAAARKKFRFGPAVYDDWVALFELNPCPDSATRHRLAETSGATFKQVSSWFNRRRHSSKRQPCEKRLKLTSTQRSEVEAVFETTPYPDSQTMTACAKEIGCSEIQIRTWFSSARKRKGISRSRDERAREVCTFGPDGFDKLVAQFEADPFPGRATRNALAQQLGGTSTQVKNWFKVRRRREGIHSDINHARQMCTFGPAAYDSLVAQFDIDPYPKRHAVQALAAELGGTEQQTRCWFSNERKKRGIRRPKESQAQNLCVFGAAAFDELVAQFALDPYPDLATRVALAAKVRGTEKQVKTWFETRRKSQGIKVSREDTARQRCKFGPEIYDELVAQFEDDPYPRRLTMEELAERAGGSFKQIQTWFENRRSWKKRRPS